MNTAPFIHLIKTPLNYYIYDVNTNEFLKVDEDIYYYFKKGNYNNPIKKKLEDIINKGYLSTNRPKKMCHSKSKYLKYNLDENVEQINIQMTQQCNFRCTYCTYMEQDITQNRIHNNVKMTKKLAFDIVDFFVNHSKNQRKVCIGFYGGEPMLEFNLIKEIVEYAKYSFDGKDLSFTISTNGSLFNNENLDFFSNNNFSILVSLDGPEKIHNESRKFAKNGAGSYGVVEKNLMKIKNNYSELYKKIIFNAVIDSRNDIEKIYNYFENELFINNTVQFNEIDEIFFVEKTIPSNKYLINKNKEQFKAYLNYFNIINNQQKSKVEQKNVFKSIDKIIKRMEDKAPIGDEMSHSGPCIPGQKRLFINVFGDFYPCERVNEGSEAVTIGNIKSGFDYEKADKILNICKLTEEECKNCWAIFHCLICVKSCDNNGKLSREFKLSHCASIKKIVESNFKEYLLFKEINEELLNG